MASPFFRTKSVSTIMAEANDHQGGLKKVLTAVDLTAIGVGAIIGAGIFVLTGTAAATAAGPGIMISYVFAGFICILCALCYAEFAAWLPISGSAYTYAYASVGEIFAWIIGWDLVLEYTIGSATVAVGWAEYFAKFLTGFGITIPYHAVIGGMDVNFAAGIIVALLTGLLVIGIKESARFNAVMVGVKLLVVLFVIIAGFKWVKPENWTPFLPYGPGGIFAGAALIFFAYIGFDAVSTAAEEVKNPQRDLPIGIIASLLICTLLYILVSAVITGMVPYNLIDQGAPLAAAFGSVGDNTAQMLIGLGGVTGLTTVVLILLMSQPRIYFSMARDGLLMPWFSKIHPRFRTPINSTILTGIIAGSMAMLVPLSDLHHMVSIGTLFAFAVVSGSVLISRYRSEAQPMESTWIVLMIAVGLGVMCYGLTAILKDATLLFNLTSSHGLALWAGLITSVVGTGMLAGKPILNVPDTFKCPLVPFVPVVGMFGAEFMMTNLPVEAWLRLFGWLAVGMVIYWFYGVKHSKVSLKHDAET
ncbi:MAG: amino acid permease [Candidatus Melainabacteria bacterium]